MIVVNEIFQMGGRFYLLLYTLVDCRLDENICFQMHYHWCLNKVLFMESSFLLLGARLNIDESPGKGNQLKNGVLKLELCELKWEMQKDTSLGILLYLTLTLLLSYILLFCVVSVVQEFPI